MFKNHIQFEIKYLLIISRPKHLGCLAICRRKDRKVDQFCHKQRAAFICKINLFCKKKYLCPIKEGSHKSMVNSTCYEVSFRIESKKLYLKKGSKTGYVENRQRKKILTLFTLNNFFDVHSWVNHRNCFK